MKMKSKYYILSLVLVSLLGGLSSCYRDDINFLYSEQYINDGNRELILHPKQAKYSNEYCHYDENSNTLYVTPSSTVELPYTKKGDLPKILATLPSSWTHSIDYAKKMITLHTPDLQHFVKEANDGGEGEASNAKQLYGASSLLFTSRTKKGITFSQEIKAVIPDSIYVKLFYRRRYGFASDLKGYDIIYFTPGLQRYDTLYTKELPSKKYTIEVHLLSSTQSGFSDTVMTKTPDELVELMNRPIQAILPRFKEGYKFENIEQKGFLYDADSTYVYAAKNGNITDYFLGSKVNKDGTPELLPGPALNTDLPEHKRPVFIRPIGWNSFCTAGKPFTQHDGPMAYRRPFERISMHTQLELKNPHRFFGLDASEAFDAKKVVLYTAANFFYLGNMTTLLKMRSPIFLCKAENVCTYDKAKDQLSGGFSCIPVRVNTTSHNNSLIVEYTKANGSKVYKLVHQRKQPDEYSDLLASIMDGWRTFNVDANPGKEASSYADVIYHDDNTNQGSFYKELIKVPLETSVLDHKKELFTPELGDFDDSENDENNSGTSSITSSVRKKHTLR